MKAPDIRRRLLLGGAVSAVVLRPSHTVKADTSFTNFGFAATGAPTVRTMPDRLNDVINVKDWGAVGDGHYDDAPAIQAAIDYCISKGGGRVFFPPAVNYTVNSPLAIGSPSRDVGVQLVGAGAGCCYIHAGPGYSDPNGYGFVISKGGPSNTYDNIERIESLGGVSAKVTRTAVLIRSCLIGGTIDASRANGALIDSCHGAGGSNNPPESASPGCAAGTVGIFLGNQGVCIGTRLQGNYDVAFALSGNNSSIIGCAAEVCSTGCRVGWGPNGETAAYGASVFNFQTERCNTALDLYNCTGGFISANRLTGGAGTPGPTVGPITGMSWSSTDGGTVTVTTPGPHHIPSGPYISPAGGRTYLLQIDTNAAYSIGNQAWLPSATPPYFGVIVATVINATQFSYTGVGSNPGKVRNDGKGNCAYWNYPLQYGIRCRKVYETVLTAASIDGSMASVVAGVDLDYDGSADHRNNVCVGTYSQFFGWKLPTNTKNLAGWKFMHCSGNANPFISNASTPVGTMHFADLPGQPGVLQPGPLEGQEYDIVDSPTAAAGNFAKAVAGGGGSNHVKVRWDGAGWKISG